jgi:diguanylate cyclase (GGDEF)-like protein
MSEIRILLGAADSNDRNLVERALLSGGGGTRLTCAHDRDEVIRAGASAGFDCVLLSDRLVGPDGSTLRELEVSQPDVPVIILSGRDEVAHAVASMHIGAADFLRVPQDLDPEELRSRIEQAVERGRRKLLERRREDRRMRVLRHRAETDTLTGLHNRDFLTRMIRSERTSNDRRHRCAVIMIDIDNFKSINDRFGHAEGDRVLREVATVLRRHASGPDTVGRWGGEEFLALRPSCELAEAWMWADDLRLAIRAGVRVRGADAPVTVSVGVEVVATSSLDDHALARADHAMYLAKFAGRDRVCSWPMVRAIDAACDLSTMPELSVGDRLGRVCARVLDGLGANQRYYVGAHGDAVRDLSVDVGRSLGFDEDAMQDLALSAQYHDIGKVGVPESLLVLPRGLTEPERRLVAQHARFGGEIFRSCGASERVIAGVEAHHTRYDIKRDGPTAPDLGDVIIACDALSAMICGRVYRPACALEEGLREMRAQRAAQFHPDVVDALLDLGDEPIKQSIAGRTRPTPVKTSAVQIASGENRVAA